MVDRARVLCGLKCCETDSIASCNPCPYRKLDYPACITDLISDAEELLNPLPLVLTVPEIEDSVGEILWMEWKSNGDELRPMTPVCVERVGPSLISGEEMQVIEFTDGMDRVADYGSRYRLWSCRPTDEQRREAKWNDGNLH